MGAALGGVLGLAVGIAVSPLPVAAVILMLLSGRARANSAAFAVGWVAGIAAVVTVVQLLPGLEASSGAPSDTTGWIKLGLGALLLVVAVRQWRGRAGPGDEPSTPGWMDRIDGLRPAGALGLAVLLSAVNPKNLALGAAAGASLGAASLTTGAVVGATAAFTLLAASTVLVPVVAYLVAGDRLDDVLRRTKTWLIANNGVVMAVLLVVFGVSLVGDGIQILAA